jgi:hypothetical protein
MRAIASLGCEGATRAIASSMSPHAPPPAGPHTDIQCRNRTPVVPVVVAPVVVAPVEELGDWEDFDA